MFYTYAHIRPDTNKPFYIGKGAGRRAYRKDHRNDHWKNIVKKYGYKTEILAYWENEQDAFLHEKFLIDCFKSINIDLVNQSSGGDGNDWRGGFSFKGKKHSIESKEKCRLVNLGKPKSQISNQKNAESHKKPIQINDLIYDSWKDASEKLNIPMGSFYYLLKNKISEKSKYFWIKQIKLVM